MNVVLLAFGLLTLIILGELVAYKFGMNGPAWLVGFLTGFLVASLVEVRQVIVTRWRALRIRTAQTIEVQDEQHPPQFAEYLLYFLPKTIREPLLGDLEEEYRQIYAKFGKRKATFWYYAQVALSFYPLMSKGVKRLIKWGVLGWIGGVVKRLIS